MIKVLLADDHKIFRESLRKMLVSEGIADVLAEAADGKQLLDLLEEYTPDVVIMDISMPVMDGVETSKKALQKNPHLKILTLSSFGDEKYYYKMVEAGVKGFVIKSSGISELEQAITEIHEGGCWFSNELLRKVIVNIGKLPAKEMEISDREIETLKLICDGLTNDQIAEKLHLSPETIKWHRNNLLSKTGCNNTAALVMYAIKNGLIQI
ncbi:MAG TPA: response regulator transcription factor [Bacteroidales bacterium]|nr:response regulator transcription factor [Bacteroidales bacterium]